MGEDGAFGVFAGFALEFISHAAGRFFICHVLDECFFGAGLGGEWDGMFVSGDFADEPLGDVLGGGLCDARRGDIHDVEIWLDVADDPHVEPEVRTTAGGKNCKGCPVVEIFWSFIAGGIDVISLEEVHALIENCFNGWFKWNACVRIHFKADFDPAVKWRIGFIVVLHFVRKS